MNGKKGGTLNGECITLAGSVGIPAAAGAGMAAGEQVFENECLV